MSKALIKNWWAILVVMIFAAAAYQEHLHPVKCFPVEQLPINMR